MKKLIYLLPVLLVIVILTKGCNFENPMVSNDQILITDGPIDTGMFMIDRHTTYETPLVTSGNARIGVMQVWIDTVNFHFKFIAASRFSIKNIHLAPVYAVTNFPLSGGCPNIESFSKLVHNLPAHTRTYTFTIPIDLTKHILYVSAQLESESWSASPDCLSSWAKGIPFPNCTQFSKYFGLRYIVR
jgi:hypothetical protein